MRVSQKSNLLGWSWWWFNTQTFQGSYLYIYICYTRVYLYKITLETILYIPIHTPLSWSISKMFCGFFWVQKSKSLGANKGHASTGTNCIETDHGTEISMWSAVLQHRRAAPQHAWDFALLYCTLISTTISSQTLPLNIVLLFNYFIIILLILFY